MKSLQSLNKSIKAVQKKNTSVISNGMRNPMFNDIGVGHKEISIPIYRDRNDKFLSASYFLKHVKYVLSILILFLSIYTAMGQVKTEAYFGFSDSYEAPYDIIEIYDKGYSVAAYIEGGFGWDIKTDLNLDHLYDKIIEFNTGVIATRKIVSDEEGNQYISGFTDNSLGQWPFISKINACGEPEWCRILQYEDEFQAGAVLDLIIHNDEIILLTLLYDIPGLTDFLHLIKLNSDGEVLWKKPYASKNDYPLIHAPVGSQIIEINDNFYISGDCYYAYPDDPNNKYLRALFIAIDVNFEEKWILPFAHSDSIYGSAFNTIPINDTLLMGVGMKIIDDISENSLLMFYDVDGNEYGYNQIYNEDIGPEISQNFIIDIKRINDSLFMAEIPLGFNNTVAPPSEFIIDTAATIYDYTVHFEGIGWTYMLETYDNNFVFATGIEETKGDRDIYLYKIDENLNDVPFDPTPHNYDTLCPEPIPSGTIDLTDCLVWVDIGEAPAPNAYYDAIAQIPLTPYPSPASGNITIAMENTQHHQNIELQVYDLFGRLVKKEQVFTGQQEISLDVSKMQSGMYQVAAFSSNKLVGRTSFVIW